VQAVAAIPLEARRFADLGALAAIRLETRRFEDIAGYQFKAMIQRVRAAEQHAAELLDGRTVWMVNSTAVGGGVSQLLRTLLPYWRGAGIDVRWMVLRGSAEFFQVTKRFHNHLQGAPRRCCRNPSSRKLGLPLIETSHFCSAARRPLTRRLRAAQASWLQSRSHCSHWTSSRSHSAISSEVCARDQPRKPARISRPLGAPISPA
jgi:hypothetical protein